MSRTAAITVAVATCERPAGLARCLDALLAGYLVPAEIIVVDQGPGGEARPVVEELRPAACNLYYVQQERRGLSASRNAAWQRATQPVVAVTDDDCVPAPGWIEALDGAFRSNAAPAAVTGRVLPLGPPAPDTWALSSRLSPKLMDYCFSTAPWRVGTGANFACAREWLIRLGGYDRRLGAGSAGRAGEDTDMIYRLLRAGACIRYDPGAVVYHERQPERRRVESRLAYGHGIGACCALWMRAGDRVTALAALSRWLGFRGRRLCTAAMMGQWPRVREERLVLRGTLAGLRYGGRAQ